MLPRQPISFLINNVVNPPAPFLKLQGDKTAMAAPGEAFSTNDTRDPIPSYLLQLPQPQLEIGGSGKILVAALTISA